MILIILLIHLCIEIVLLKINNNKKLKKDIYSDVDNYR